jgi:integrase
MGSLTGRPSKVAPFRELVGNLLSEDPARASMEIFERVACSGYGGRKSALYAMVTEMRAQLGIAPRTEEIAKRKAATTADRANSKVERVSLRQRLDEEDRKRVEAAKAERQQRMEQERAPSEPFRPRAEDEQSARLRVIARDWLETRRATHRSAIDDRCRWRVHLAPAFGDLEPSEVDPGRIRTFVEEKLADGMSSTTVGHCVGLLSSLFTDLVEQELAARNPVRAVPRAVRRLYRNAHDPRTTPFLERKEDIARIRAALTEPVRTMFTVGVMSGLRPGELRALEWADISADMRVMHVQRAIRQGKVNPPKSGRGRVVPISPGLAQVLVEWRRATGAAGLIFQSDGRRRYIDLKDMRASWYEGLRRAAVAPILFYRATRHTFASQWVMAGHSIEKLSKILGHSSVLVTEHYAHLKPESLSVPDLFSIGPDHRSINPMTVA